MWKWEMFAGFHLLLCVSQKAMSLISTMDFWIGNFAIWNYPIKALSQFLLHVMQLLLFSPPFIHKIWVCWKCLSFSQTNGHTHICICLHEYFQWVYKTYEFQSCIIKEILDLVISTSLQTCSVTWLIDGLKFGPQIQDTWDDSGFLFL